MIALGFGALFWSHHLALGAHDAASEWWQSTWQALGVGLMVGGVVDVLAITGLDRVAGAAERRRKIFNDELRKLLPRGTSSSPSEPDRKVVDLLVRNYKLIDDLDPDLRSAVTKSGALAKALAEIVANLPSMA